MLQAKVLFLHKTFVLTTETLRHGVFNSQCLRVSVVRAFLVPACLGKVLEDSLQEQQQSHDRKGNAHNRTDYRETNKDANDHEHDAEDHCDKPPGQLHDDCQQFPNRGKGP